MSLPTITRLCLIVAMLMLAGSPTRSAIGQDIFVEDEAADPNLVNMNAFELHENNFEQWVFGNGARSNTIRGNLESALMTSLNEIHRSCKLNEAQKKKLLLAGHGDIKHFLDKVAEARQVFDELKHDQNNINAIFQETQPIATMLRNGLFGPESIFDKTIASTLDPEQEAAYRKILYEKNEFRHRASLRLTIARLDQVVGLTAAQRSKLFNMLFEEIKPLSKPAGQYETQVLILKMGKVSEAKFREILNDAQYKALRRQIQQNQGLEAFFKQNGFLEEDPPAEKKPEGAKAPVGAPFPDNVFKE